MFNSKKIVAFFFSLLICGGIFFASQTLAYSVQDTGLTKTADAANLTNNNSLPVVLGNVIGSLLTLVGMIFLVLMVYGGMLWLLAEGDESKISKARGFIFHSVIGLVITLSAYVITNFVLTAVINAQK